MRLGRVQAIERDRIVFAQGELATSPGQVHVHCSAAGLPRAPSEPVFQGNRIARQSARVISPASGQNTGPAFLGPHQWGLAVSTVRYQSLLIRHSGVSRFVHRLQPSSNI